MPFCIGIKEWISNHNHIKLWHVTHPYLNSCPKPHRKQCTWLLIHAIIPFNLCWHIEVETKMAAISQTTIFKCIFLNENICISINASLNFVPRDQINNIPALVQIMTCRLVGAKPISESMMVSLLTHICIFRPQWVNERNPVELWVLWEFC